MAGSEAPEGAPPPLDSETAATWGGPGFRERRSSHAEEVAKGERWHPCGVRSEVAPLREILLAWPGDDFDRIDSNDPSRGPDHFLMLGPVDLEALRRETEAILDFFESQGVAVHLYRRPSPAPGDPRLLLPNLIFQRDLFFMTSEGAVLGRPAGRVRAGEERFTAEALARRGIPILATLRGRAHFEGADALWLDEATVLLGVGRRTNVEGAAAITGVLQAQGVETLQIPMPQGVQHLLGIVNFIDEDLAAVDSEKAPPELLRILRERGYELLMLPPDKELRSQRGMNFVPLGPRRLVMPAKAPGLRRRFEEAGAEVFEVVVDQYLRAGGGVACLSGILWRG